VASPPSAAHLATYTPTPTTAQAHPTAAGTPALLVSRVVLAVLVPAASGKATILPSYVVDYALEALAAQLIDNI
tara:strand:- start:270 stop:491 length:222 start_codon:yes stop_codon:yes gene_type:complete